MEEYKRTRESLGSSDIAALVAVGIGDGVETEAIPYGADGSYSAYIVRDRNLVPGHYRVAWATTEWLRIYDDAGLAWKSSPEDQGKAFTIYRAGDFGTIILIEDM